MEDFPSSEPMLRQFVYKHLPPETQGVAGHFADLAMDLCLRIEPSQARTMALQKLLEARDVVVKAKEFPGG